MDRHIHTTQLCWLGVLVKQNFVTLGVKENKRSMEIKKKKKKAIALAPLLGMATYCYCDKTFLALL